MFSKETATKKIGALIERIDELKRIERGSAQFKKWIRDTQVALEHIFGKESRHIADFNQIRYSLGSFSGSTPEHKFQQRYVVGLENAKHVLVSMIEEIQEYWEEKTAKKQLHKIASKAKPHINLIRKTYSSFMGMMEAPRRPLHGSFLS